MLKNKDNVYQIFIYVFFYIFHLGMVMFKTMISTKRLYIHSADIVFCNLWMRSDTLSASDHTLHIRYTLSSETGIFLRKRLPVNLSNFPAKELFNESVAVVSKDVLASFSITKTRKSVGERLYVSPFFFIGFFQTKYPKNMFIANLSKHKI